METDRQSLDPNLASLSSLRKSNNDICITQFYPAWSLHALLRFCNFSYECNNSDINTSLGMALPHLQDGHFIYSLRMALEHLENRRQQAAIMMPLLMQQQQNQQLLYQQQMQNINSNRPVTTNCNTYGNQTNCVSR